MLPAHIVSQILERERQTRDKLFEHQPVVEMPLAPPPGPVETTEESHRGVVIIDL